MAATQKTAKVFSDDERDAMKERAKEQKAEARRGADAAAGLADVLAKIAELPAPDKAMAERLHALITAAAPNLSAKTWYGMPAYAKDGKLVVFFKPASKFNSRYATLRLRGSRPAGRRVHVADLVRDHEADPGGRDEDHCHGEEGGRLTFALFTRHPATGGPPPVASC